MAWFISGLAAWIGYTLLAAGAFVLVAVAIQWLSGQAEARRALAIETGRQQERLRMVRAALLFSDDSPTQALLLDLACRDVRSGSEQAAFNRWRVARNPGVQLIDPTTAFARASGPIELGGPLEP